jgi:hypothetical protein
MILTVSKLSFPSTSPSSSSPADDGDGDDDRSSDEGLSTEYIQRVIDLPAILDMLATRFEEVMRVSEGWGRKGGHANGNGNGGEQVGGRAGRWEIYAIKMRQMKEWFERKLGVGVDMSMPVHNGNNSNFNKDTNSISDSNQNNSTNNFEFAHAQASQAQHIAAVEPAAGPVMGVGLDSVPGLTGSSGTGIEFDDAYWHEVIRDWCSL